MRAPVLLSALLATACGGSSYDDGDDGGGGTACTAETATAVTTVQLAGTSFSPSCIRVAPSATVTFRNVDTMLHTVTSDPGQPETFDSGNLSPGATFVHTFAATPGTVRLHCELHVGMRATVIVQ